MNKTKCGGRSKIFLVDLENLKKLEWERRRKLRLQQVRQQARSIASFIRKQTKGAQSKEEDLAKFAEAEAVAKIAEDRKREMEGKLTENLVSVGTAHSSADYLSEVDQLLQHKTELQETVAQLRMELAIEKGKEHSKPRNRLIGRPQEGVTVSKVSNALAKMSSVAQCTPAKSVERDKTLVVQTPPNLVSSTKSGNTSKNFSSQERTIASPPSLVPIKKAVAGSTSLKSTIERSNCPPTTDDSEVEPANVSSEGDESCPSTSVKKKDFSNVVRMYDHSMKKCSEYAPQCGVVRTEDPSCVSMKTLIEEEEKLHAKKVEEDIENRRVDLQRGQKALKEEIAKQDFDVAIKDCYNSSREKRLQRAFEYPLSREGGPTGGNDLSNDLIRSSQTNVLENVENFKSTQKPSVNFSDQPVSSIVSRLTKKREEVLEDSENSAEESLIDSEHEQSDEESCIPPLWIREELATQRRVVENEEVRATTPETVMSTLIEVGSNGKSAEEESGVESSSSTSTCAKSNENSPSANSARSADANRQPDSPDGAENTSPSASSSNDINLEIIITGDSENGQQPAFKTPVRTSDSSTSYFSPPDPLNPQQLSVLSDVLSKVSTRSHNPVLLRYIARVLNMSRRSLSNLEVSSCSDISVESDIDAFSKRPTHAINRSTTGYHATHKNVRFDCTDNLSTAGTIMSIPELSSATDDSSSDHTIQIAHLLRNICRLQEIYSAHSSVSETLSESRTSYQSVSTKVDPSSFKHLIPRLARVSTHDDNTGLFSNSFSDSSKSPRQFSTIRRHVPSHLNPQPIVDVPDCADSSPSASSFHIKRYEDPRPNGKPVYDFGSFAVPIKNEDKVIKSLSDIESVVSSIQNSPDKKNTSKLSGFLPLSQHPQGSTLSEISSSDIINSSEMSNNNLIESTTGSSDIEDVFRSLGLGWAIATLRRTRDSNNLPAESSSKSNGSWPKSMSSSVRSGSSYRHSTPVKSSMKPAVSSEAPQPNLPSLTPPDINLQYPSLFK